MSQSPDASLAHATPGRWERLRDAHLPALLACTERICAEKSPPGSSLTEMCAYHYQTGGKRLRALLPLALGEALGEDPGRLVALGAACEMIHNATLVHDDIQDGDRVRRGQPTVWVRYGEPRAINLGDAMFFYGILLAAELPYGAAERLAVCELVARLTVRVIDGQEREFLLKDEATPTLAGYFAMVEGKTSGLFALPILATALLCRASDVVLEHLEGAATHLGVLFQMQDDVLDLYSDKGREQRGSDIAEGKMSALVVHFLEHGPPEEAAWLMGVLQAGREAVSAQDIARATELLRTHGALAFALGEIARRRALVLEPTQWNDCPEVQALLAELIEVILAPIADVG